MSLMGLLYIFPIDENETERVMKTDNTITLKTYGLPMIFWAYLATIYIVVFTMWLVSSSAMDKLLTYDDSIMIFLYWLVKGTLFIGPLVLLGFFFYEKFLIKSHNSLTIIHRIFFIPIIKKNITLDSPTAFSVDHFLDSPNVAKMRSQEHLRGFENRGYFELHAKSNGKSIAIDRHSRKSDLVKMQELLSKY